MRHNVLYKWTWKTGVLLIELPSFLLQVQFLVGKVSVRVRIFAGKLPIITSDVPSGRCGPKPPPRVAMATRPHWPICLQPFLLATA